VLADDALGGPRERRRSGEHLVEHATEAVEVTAAVGVVAAGRLLRAHVQGRADAQSGLCQPRSAGRADSARDAEVGYARMTAREHDVLGLDVAVDDVVAVRVRERIGDLARDLERVIDRQLLLACEPVSQRTALDVRHDVVEEAVRFARIVERQDVRVIETGRDLDLAQEPVRPEHGREIRLEDLDGDRATVLQILGEPDGGHAAASEDTFDRIPFGERLLQPVDHRRPRSGSWLCYPTRRKCACT
jgi:hypothetical protein